MNQQRYMAIRSSLDLRKDPHFLSIFLFQSVLLLGSCGFILSNYSNSNLRFLAIPLVSLLMFRSFAFMHEAVHGLLSRNTQLNHLLGVFSGACCLLSYESWKQAHIEHHRWSGNLDKDPVMAMIKIFPTLPKPLRTALSFSWNWWMPMLSVLQHFVFWSITVKYTFEKPQSFVNIMSVLFPIALWVGLVGILPVNMSLSILLPSVILYLIGTEVINAPHHLGLPYFRGETKIPLWEQFKTARSCAYPSWLARLVVLNFNYHTEHHMYPYVPWYHLDKIHRVLSVELQDQYNLDPQFDWVLKNRSKELGTVFGSSQATSSKQSRAA